MSFQYPKTIATILKKRQAKLTSRQLAQIIFETQPHEVEAKRKRAGKRQVPLDTDEAMIAQIAAEISSQRSSIEKLGKVKTLETRPRLYYYSNISDDEEVTRAEQQTDKTDVGDDSQSNGLNDSYTEHSLYPILAQYLWSEQKIYTRRIDERRSGNRKGTNGNKWLYPDLVGMQDLSETWEREVRDCVKQYADKKTKLWSFEVKKLINRSNVRECFFQAVSNSSWGNYGYLVACEISGSDTMDELQILCGVHGIGLIRLDRESPTDSQILIQSKEKNDIDWNTVNRIASENKDFLDYVKVIRQFYQTGEIRYESWDVCCKGEE